MRLRGRNTPHSLQQGPVILPWPVAVSLPAEKEEGRKLLVYNTNVKWGCTL